MTRSRRWGRSPGRLVRICVTQDTPALPVDDLAHLVLSQAGSEPLRVRSGIEMLVEELDRRATILTGERPQEVIRADRLVPAGLGLRDGDLDRSPGSLGEVGHQPSLERRRYWRRWATWIRRGPWRSRLRRAFLNS